MDIAQRIRVAPMLDVWAGTASKARSDSKLVSPEEIQTDMVILSKG